MDEVVAEEVIELTLPPVAELMALVRFTAATLGARAQFSLDEIEDLRLASGELCLSLMSGLGRGEMRPLRVQLTRRGDTVEISCAVDLGADVALNDSPEREWSLRILDALVDAHGRQVDGLAARGWLKKRRARSRVD